ncbi:MAG: bifunctional phosphopantothenoylcysteine decarboxylase/phosphopantothenate--cysteine ligase CoaBC, partial [Brucellaceae bacterium]|nr:bifunctional phosphopantothenoylcysteine decarboxylase/phosphopantothenate--cysteine ligase CoaBC [Brucellaceae bacterium]
MASITIRNLDEDVKEALRRQAAANGRSMEEEVRVLLSGETQVSAPLSPASDPVAQSLKDKRILLIIGGGIAAYKVLDLIRRLKERGAHVRPVMTQAAQAFITPLSVGALAADHVYTDLFSREDEQDVGHIRLARDADLIVVAPATADRMAQMVAGLGGDLAAAILLARKVPVLIAPAMNPAMWSNPATQRNVRVLHQDGVHFIGPERGEMAEKGEAGTGRMSEPLQIVAKIEQLLLPPQYLPLAGKKIIITSGPTHEPIDPVRYIANRSSGKQGHAIAAALARLGADVRLVAGPVTIPDPQGVKTIHVETARQMRDAVEAQLPADAAVMVAAVADWRIANAADQKIKKQAGEASPSLQMVENPDILATIGHHAQRPHLVIGFA